MTDPSPSSPAEPDGKLSRGPYDPEVPPELWNRGVLFSALLIFGGFAVMLAANGLSADVLLSIGALAVCIGFGLALAVFGTRAGGKFGNFNVVGGGAMAIVLYMLLVFNPIANSPKFLMGEIYRTSMLEDVRVRAKEVFLTGRMSENGDFSFFAKESDLGDGMVKFTFEWPDEATAADANIPKVLFINCIQADYLRGVVRRQQTLTLELEARDDGQFSLVNTSNNAEMGRPNDSNCSAPASQPSIVDEVGFFDSISFAAFAQSAAPVDIPKALAMLDSDDGQERDLARDELASLRGLEAYNVMASSWDINNSSYRSDLGRLVAWSAAINQDRATAVSLAEALSEDQLQYLVQMTGQGDITMRQFATEILHRLLETTSWQNGPSPERAQDIVEATLEVLAIPGIEPLPKPSMQFDPANLLYNTIVAVDFAGCNIGVNYRSQVLDRMMTLAAELGAAVDKPKTATKLKKVMTSLNACT